MTTLWLFDPAVVIVLFGSLVVASIVLAARRPSRRAAWIRRALMALAVAGIAVTPAVPVEGQPQVVSNVNVFFVVDKTGSMAAEDYNGGLPRLEGVKADIAAITTALPGSRYSIISFDSVATRQLPLTTDARAVLSWADTVVQEISYASSGSSLNRPYRQLQSALERDVTKNPQNIRIVFFLSDGEVRPGGPAIAADWPSLAGYIDGGYVLGYGTAAGGRMRVYDGITLPDSTVPFITDPATGADAISRIDEGQLRQLAAQLGIPYTHRTAPDDAMGLVSDIDFQELLDDGRLSRTAYRHVVWPFAIALALLVAWELWALPHRPRGVSRG